MSTKIFNGFKLAISDLGQLHDFFMSWRSHLVPLQSIELAKLHARRITEIIDQAALHPGRHVGEIPLLKSLREVMDRQKELKRSGLRDTEVDFQFEACLFPYQGAIYGMIFCERPEWRNAFMELDDVSSFSYWDNSEKPDDISDEEWSHRALIWREILTEGPDNIPAMRSFIAQCTVDQSGWDSDLILEHIPSFETRLNRATRNTVLEEEFQRLLLELDESERQDRLFSTLFKAEDNLKTTKGLEALEQRSSRLINLLQPEITKLDLSREIGLSNQVHLESAASPAN